MPLEVMAVMTLSTMVFGVRPSRLACWRSMLRQDRGNRCPGESEHRLHRGALASLCKLLGNRISSVHVVTADLDIEGCGKPLIDDRIDEPARLEVGLHGWKIGSELRSHSLHVGKAAQTVIFLQAHLDKCGMHPELGCRSPKDRV